MARSLTVISLLLQSTTHCRYQVYTKFLLTYTAIYWGNRKVLPLGITALQPQSHFHLGTPYKTHRDLHVNCRYFCPILTKSELSRHDFLKARNVKFHANSPSGSCADACEQTVGQTVVTKVIGALRNYQTRFKAVSGEQTVIFCFA